MLATLADTKVIPPHPRKSVICGVLAQMRSAIYPKKLTADSECSERPDSYFSLKHTLICVTMLSYFFTESVNMSYFLIIPAFGIRDLVGKLARWLRISKTTFFSE